MFALQGRSRAVPRVLPTSTSHSGRGNFVLSPTHPHLNNGHTESSSKHPGGSTSSSKHPGGGGGGTSGYEHTKKRLQPIGADAKPRSNAGDRTLNGISKRSSLILEGGSKDTQKQGVLKQQLSVDGKKSCSSSSSSLSLPPSTVPDQTSKEPPTAAHAPTATTGKLLPRLV